MALWLVRAGKHGEYENQFIASLTNWDRMK
jgi:hypothetical protein